MFKFAQNTIHAERNLTLARLLELAQAKEASKIQAAGIADSDRTLALRYKPKPKRYVDPNPTSTGLHRALIGPVTIQIKSTTAQSVSAAGVGYTTIHPTTVVVQKAKPVTIVENRAILHRCADPNTLTHQHLPPG